MLNSGKLSFTLFMISSLHFIILSYEVISVTESDFLPNFGVGTPFISSLEIMFSTASCWKPATKISPFVFCVLSASSLSLSIIAVNTVVLPVPGGPWIIAISGVFNAISIASSWFDVGAFVGKIFSLHN